MSKLQNTNRQHHVAQFHLREWAIKGKLFCLQNGVVRRAAVKDVAVQNRFYELQPLSAADVNFIRFWISKTPEDSRETHHRTLDIMTAAHRFEAEFGDLIDKVPEALQALEHIKINQQELWYGALEDEIAPVLKRAMAGDLGFYDDKDLSSSFLLFLAQQLCRTKSVKDKTLGKMRANKAYWREMTAAGIDFENCWTVLTEIIAQSIGRSLYLDRRERRLVVVENNTDTPFITSDAVMLNLLAGDGEIPDDLSIYYPISPRYALILTHTDGVSPHSTETLTSDDVGALNHRIAEAALMQIFGDRPEALSAYISRSKPQS